MLLIFILFLLLITLPWKQNIHHYFLQVSNMYLIFNHWNNFIHFTPAIHCSHKEERFSPPATITCHHSAVILAWWSIIPLLITQWARLTSLPENFCPLWKVYLVQVTFYPNTSFSTSALFMTRSHFWFVTNRNKLTASHPPPKKKSWARPRQKGQTG